MKYEITLKVREKMVKILVIARKKSGNFGFIFLF